MSSLHNNPVTVQNKPFTTMTSAYQNNQPNIFNNNEIRQSNVHYETPANAQTIYTDVQGHQTSSYVNQTNHPGSYTQSTYVQPVENRRSYYASNQPTTTTQYISGSQRNVPTYSNKVYQGQPVQYTEQRISHIQSTPSHNYNAQIISTGQPIQGQNVIYTNQPKQSYRQGSERVINETKMPSRVIETRQLESVVVESRELEPYEVSRHTLNADNTRVRENQLPIKEQRPSITKRTANVDMTFKSEKAVINQRIVDKYIDVMIEKPVPRYVEKEVYYDVIIERPREIITERDVVTEIFIERPYEKIIEVPIQKIVEVPIKKTIERINYVDVHREVPYQRIVEKQIEHVVENPIINERVVEVDEKDIGKYKYDKILPTDVRVYQQDVVKEVRRTIQNFIEKQVEVPREVIVTNQVQRIIERPVERVVERPVYIENRIEKVVNVPYDEVVYNKIIQIVEEPEYIENLIDKPVYREVIQEIPREIIQERLVEKPVYSERIISKSVDRYVDKPVKVERIVQVDIPEYVEHPIYIDNVIRREVYKVIQQEVIYETIVPYEKVTVVEETIPVPIEKIIDRPVERTVEQYVDNIIEREVIEYNIIEDIQYIDKLVNVPVEKRVQNPIIRQNIIQKPIYIDKIVEKRIPRNIEHIVEVTVERIVEVPVDVIVEVPIFKERQVFKDVYVNKNIKKSNTRFNQQVQDLGLVSRVESQRNQITELKTKIVRTKAEIGNSTKKQVNVTLHSDIDYTSQNHVLTKKIQELEQAIRDAHVGKIRKSLLN